MPQLDSITISDGTTPATFDVDSISGTHVQLYCASDEIALRRLLHLDRPKNPKSTLLNRSVRSNFIAEVTDSSGVTRRVSSAIKTEFNLPTTVDKATRIKYRIAHANALLNAAIAEGVDEGVWYF